MLRMGGEMHGTIRKSVNTCYVNTAIVTKLEGGSVTAHKK
jgi:hypothetical protein